MPGIYRTIACAALATLISAPAHGAIVRAVNFEQDPPPAIAGNIGDYLRVDQTKWHNTAVDVLAADLPSAWVSSGGASSRWWIKRTTPTMVLWSLDYFAETMTGRQTIHTIDMTPYAALPSITLDISVSEVTGGVKSRTYTINGTPLAISEPVPEPTSAAVALFTLVGFAAIGRQRPSTMPHALQGAAGSDWPPSRLQHCR